jgi:PAS domain S-box-containing protein
MTLRSTIDEEIARLRDGRAPYPLPHAYPLPHDDHSVQFYDDDDHLADIVSTFLCAGFALGEPSVVIATERHRRVFCTRLSAAGFDVEEACRSGRLTTLDAGKTLSELSIDGRPDQERFRKVIGGLIAETARAAGANSVRAYGEMVDLLWKSEHRDFALRLEEMWNDLQRVQRFKLLCAYAMNGFYRDPAGIHDLCRTHGSVLPLGPGIVYPRTNGDGPRSPDNGSRAQAESLHRSLRELQRAERELRERGRELEDFVENAPVGVHQLGPDGVVQWANRAELALLGYEADEYVGRNIAEIHVDQNVASDFLARLSRGETLHDFEATLKSRDGAHKHVIISSNVQWRDGRFAYARSFTRDVTDRKRTEEANQRARQELERAVRFSEMFTAILGHDLRNPLGGILATAEMAARRPDSERMVKSLSRIIASGQRMARMIDQLLGATRRGSPAPAQARGRPCSRAASTRRARRRSSRSGLPAGSRRRYDRCVGR